MTTIFTTFKPFIGDDAILQENAVLSWAKLNPKPFIVAFGSDEGVARVCLQYGLHWRRLVAQSGRLPLVSAMFKDVQSISRHEQFCYIDADVLLGQDFVKAVANLRGEYLLCGQSWTSGKAGYLSPAQNNRNIWGQDYFVFSRGQFTDLPPFPVGFPGWDNWLIYHARSKGMKVIDATDSIIAVHQEHPANPAQEGIANREHLFSIKDATHLLVNGDLLPARSPIHLWRRAYTWPVLHPRYHSARVILDRSLRLTRGVREIAGLTLSKRAAKADVQKEGKK